MAQNILVLSVLAVLVISVGVSAKRGCSAFGHSCFGGHGKRSDSSVMGLNSELLARQQLGQEETPPHPVYPQSYGMLSSGDDIIPIRDGGTLDIASHKSETLMSQSESISPEGVADRDETNARDTAKIKLRDILKYWMDKYRRSRPGAGSVVDTL